MVTAEEHAQTLAEEFEVLESIYLEGELETPILQLAVRYTPEYPDALPAIAIRVEEDPLGVLGEAPDAEHASFSSDLRAGVQQLHTELEQVVPSHLREALTDYIQRMEKEGAERASRAREAEIAAEEEKFLGTAVTAERFKEWRIAFMKEYTAAREKSEAEHMATLSNREREEYKKYKAKLSGRELFSKPSTAPSVEDEKSTDDSVREVDWSLYSREAREEQARDDAEVEEEGIVAYSDDE
ncbi:hypothetical protein MVES_003549 [Malassezia vespertilionis]|uniref:RWD domain-containing protein n=1 Tax=Malassezia vespertilionis TaxID=2020962 RepID=A0A2N1J826_9BASI|nr:hypothetical protein MVES_003549 [Malassezia vespertilionis]